MFRLDRNRYAGGLIIYINEKIPRKALTMNVNSVWHNPLREKSPDTEFFLVRMRENTDLKKLRIWTLFTQWSLQSSISQK